MMEKRAGHAICLLGDQIVAAGGYNESGYLDTCEAFDSKSKRLVIPPVRSFPHRSMCKAYSPYINTHMLTAGLPCRG